MKKRLKYLLMSQPSEDKFSNICPPIGLCYISANLKKEGFNAKVIDGSLYSMKELRRIIRKERPDVIGLQCLTIERGQTYRVAKMIRKMMPNVIIFVGGQHATIFPGHMFQLMPIDYVVIGEGEITTVELARAIENEESVGHIKGIAYREGHRICVNEKREFIENLDELPFPDYTNIDFNNYRFASFGKPAGPIMTSRGCPHDCAFCSSTYFWGRRYRQRSAENVLDEIEYLYRERGMDFFNFYDDNFIVNKKRLKEICDGIIERKLKITFCLAASVRVIDEERLQWLKKAGCINIGFGMESGSPKILKNINKPQTVQEIVDTVRLVQKYEIDIFGSLIVGNPGENDITMQETAAVLNELFPDKLSYAGILWILPGTQIYDMAKAKGIIDDSTWLKRDDEIFYTGDYSLGKLKRMQTKMIWYQARNRNLRQKISFFVWLVHINAPKSLKKAFRLFYYKILRMYGVI